MKSTIVLIFSVIVSIKSFCQIPQSPNIQDADGERLGRWTYLVDINFQEVRSIDSAFFYVLTDYKRGQQSRTQDHYYLNGRLLTRIVITKEGDNWIMADGENVIYRPNGVKSMVNTAKNGRFVERHLFDENGKPIPNSMHEEAAQYFNYHGSIWKYKESLNKSNQEEYHEINSDLKFIERHNILPLGDLYWFGTNFDIVTYYEAKELCQNIEGGWRLPTWEEFSTMANYVTSGAYNNDRRTGAPLLLEKLRYKGWIWNTKKNGAWPMFWVEYSAGSGVIGYPPSIMLIDKKPDKKGSCRCVKEVGSLRSTPEYQNFQTEIMIKYIEKELPALRTRLNQDVHFYSGTDIKLLKLKDIFQINGDGIVSYENGDIYWGNFKKGKLNGDGRFFSAIDGTSIIGEFKDGLPSGDVTLVDKQNKVHGAIYENGRDMTEKRLDEQISEELQNKRKRIVSEASTQINSLKLRLKKVQSDLAKEAKPKQKSFEEMDKACNNSWFWNRQKNTWWSGPEACLNCENQGNVDSTFLYQGVTIWISRMEDSKWGSSDEYNLEYAKRTINECLIWEKDPDGYGEAGLLRYENRMSSFRREINNLKEKVSVQESDLNDRLTKFDNTIETYRKDRYELYTSNLHRQAEERFNNLEIFCEKNPGSCKCMTQESIAACNENEGACACEI